MNSNTTPILMTTMTLLMRADSRTPSDSMAVRISMMIRAGRLNRVSTPGIDPGAAVRAVGNCTPRPLMSDWK